MTTVNIKSSDIKDQLWGYFDVEKLKEIAGHAGDLQFNPFQLNNMGRPVGFKDGILKAPGMLFEMAKAVVTIIEKICHDAGAIGAGGEKKKAFCEWLEQEIKLNPFLEAFDGFLIDFLVDKLIDWLNLKLGKDWINKIDLPSFVVMPPELVLADAEATSPGEFDPPTS